MLHLGACVPARGRAPKDDCGLRCEVISEFSRLEELSSDWERLWQADPKAEVFQAFAWARAWWQSYGDHFEMCTPVMWEGDEVVGILPLVKRESIVQFLGTPEADYADMLCEEGREAEVLTAALRALLHSVEQWDECILKQVAKEGRIQSHIQELPRDLSRRLQVVPVDSYQTIFLQENREQIFNSLLGKHHTRRRQNKLKKGGPGKSPPPGKQVRSTAAPQPFLPSSHSTVCFAGKRKQLFPSRESPVPASGR